MARHFFPAGTLIVFTGTKRLPRFIPHWCPMISTEMSRSEASASLVELRRSSNG